MCSHYQGIKEREKYLRCFGVEPPQEPGVADIWPGYAGAFIRAHPNRDAGDEAVPAAAALGGTFGLIPHWARDTKITRSTYNCRSETAADKPSFRDAYKRNQRCIVPAQAIFEPDWRSGRSVATRITQHDDAPLGIAGLWSDWKSPAGGVVRSFTMLTINADAHPFMRNFHKPGEEKRMVVVLQPADYGPWLEGTSEIGQFMLPYPAELLSADQPRIGSTAAVTPSLF
jgi:putative SOS response-associated peptidase YedK